MKLGLKTNRTVLIQVNRTGSVLAIYRGRSGFLSFLTLHSLSSLPIPLFTLSHSINCSSFAGFSHEDPSGDALSGTVDTGQRRQRHRAGIPKPPFLCFFCSSFLFHYPLSTFYIKIFKSRTESSRPRD